MHSALYAIPDTLSPYDRIREFEDLGKSVYIIEKKMTEHPEAFPDGVTISDPENDFSLSMYVDEKGAYCSSALNGVTTGVTIEELIELSERHYLLHNGGLELLINAVCALGKKRSFPIGKNTLIITPIGDQYNVEYR